jgi:hypothetical protein
MAQTITLQQLPWIIRGISRKLNQQISYTRTSATRKAARYMQVTAKRLAPYVDGGLRKSVQVKYLKQSTQVSSDAISDSGFHYSAYVDNKKRVRGYVFRNTQPRGGGFRGTSKGGFFTAAKDLTAKKFGKDVRSEVRKWKLIGVVNK